MDFAEKLIQLRKARGFSQEDLAGYLGVSRQAVSRWEKGSTFPDLPNLQKIVKVFGVSADYLICDEFSEEVHSDVPPPAEPVNAQAGFDFRRNRFLIVGFIWVFAALCFIVAAMGTMNMTFAGLALADILLACFNFFLHLRNNGWLR